MTIILHVLRKRTSNIPFCMSYPWRTSNMPGSRQPWMMAGRMHASIAIAMDASSAPWSIESSPPLSAVSNKHSSKVLDPRASYYYPFSFLLSIAIAAAAADPSRVACMHCLPAGRNWLWTEYMMNICIEIFKAGNDSDSPMGGIYM